MIFTIQEVLPTALLDIMPEEVQKIYIDTYNKSWQMYDEVPQSGEQDREAIAHRDAWNAVKQKYVHDEKKGIWYRKGEAPEETEDDSILDRLMSFV